ncbi:TRAP transporter substrate-binding protein DctP [Saccharopolyspora sp. HNM0983]|uniref:TRAP transporter substrate-binding protein DctP n=1 Tax=Saccharopolyspora montiporae TaxID=2781240 RepID=A0A929BD89_9PSEU|nr:TRAP transporter substrate-binding protein DctP [Saccharopolyspora sp. HNM0983]MBE9375911.1 TRAP transporter substrate-binding protein DctP [Saccharopolyspora sp. HNM0983]
MADSFPAEHPLSEGGAEFLMQRASELSGGRIDFEYFPAEQMGHAEDMLDLTRSGVVDVAMIAPAYVPAQLPLSSVADLPGMSEDACSGGAAVRSLTEDDGILLREDFAPKQIRPLAIGVIPGYEVMTGDRQVEHPDDVRGMQLRSAGGAIDRTVEALGAAPVSMPATDMYEAISRGTVDGTVLGPMSAHPYRLDEAADNSTSGAQLGSWTATYSIADKTWRELPAADRDALTRAGRETSQHLCEVVERENSAAQQEMQEGGMDFRELGTEEKNTWQRATAHVPQQWAADMARIGLPGQQVLDEFRAARAQQDREGQ